MLITLIRHGSTNGNLEKRYIGVTDEPLCAEGIEQLKCRKYPTCEVLYCSPMVRCLQTAEIIYPNMEINVVENFREIDFGKFENKNFLELSDDIDYQKWIKSNGTLPFPDGESKVDFSNRTFKAFQDVVSKSTVNHISMVVHGGTIMAIMEKFHPEANYFDFQIKNGDYVTIQT